MFVTQQFLMLQLPQHTGSAKLHLQQECAPSTGFSPAGLFSCVGLNSVFPLQERRTCVWAAACVTAEQLAGGNLFICRKERSSWAFPATPAAPRLGLLAETGWESDLRESEDVRGEKGSGQGWMRTVVVHSGHAGLWGFVGQIKRRDRKVMCWFG